MTDQTLCDSGVQCPSCQHIDEKDNCQINFRDGHSKGEYWWEVTYRCGECGHEWKDGDCSL